MPVITIRIRGPIKGKLKKIKEILTEGGAGQRQLLFSIGRAVLEKVHEAFEVKSEGGTDEAGLRWTPLSPVTIAKKKQIKAKRPSTSLDVLEETGKLQRSLMPPSPTANMPARRTDQVFRIEHNAVVVGTSREFAEAHHKGVPGKLPMRPLWPNISQWPKSWWKNITEAATIEIVKIILKILRDTR